MSPRLKKALNLLVRVLVSGGILAFLLWKIKPGRVIQDMRGANPWLLVGGAVLAVAGYTVAALRWHLFLRAQGIDIRFTETLKAMFVGLFLGNFLPAAAGVDVVRGGWVVKGHGNLAKVTASLVMDRLAGFIVLSFTALGAVWAKAGLRWPVAGIAVFLLLMTSLAFTNPFIRLMERSVGRVKWLKLGERSMSFFKAFHFYGGRPGLLALAFSLTLLLQATFAMVGHLVAGSLGHWPPIWASLILVPTVNLLSMIPVSIGGIGVREGSFIFFFSAYMPESACLALSLLYYVVCVLPTALGAVPLWWPGARQGAKTQT